MFQIRTIQRESKGRSDYTVVVPLRAKKIEPSFSPTIRIAEKPKTAGRFHEEKSQQDFTKNSYGIFSQTFAVLLIGFFFLNPFLDVYADELPLAPSFPDIVTATSDEQQATTTEQTEQLNDGAIEQANIATTTTDIATSTPEEIAPIVEMETATTTEYQEPVSVSGTTTTEYQEPVSVSGTTTPPMDIATSTPEEIVQEIPPVAPVSEVAPQREISQPTSPRPETVPMTELVPPPPPTLPQQTIIENKYLFRGNECTRTEDGGFYCAPLEIASSTGVSNPSLPRVFVGNDGDKEIFFEDTNGKVKITDNNYDDDAPSYDKKSGLIVWHALLGGRFQIMLFDRNASATKQITNESYNNTNPEVRGQSVVWQGWVNNNWEIFYTKDATEETPLIMQISTNEQPDMFPRLSDRFITWQSFFSGSWHLFVYNLENREISQINNPENGKYENPRFALLFENRKENGEVETVGYDIASGKEIPINPAHVPVPEAPAQAEKDKAVPVPASGGTASTTQAVKNPGGKDEEGDS